MARNTRAATVRSAALALVAGVVAFGGSFAAARALSGGDDSAGTRTVQRLPDPLVTVSNLERAPTIKPLRSAAGAPPAPAAGPPEGTP